MDNGNERSGKSGEVTEANPRPNTPACADSGVRRIELVWPGKGLEPVRSADGSWTLVEPRALREMRPLLAREAHGDVAGHPSLVVEGGRLEALTGLSRAICGKVKLAYLDLPRVSVDDKSRAFQGDTDRLWSTYLSVLREHVQRVYPLLSRDGCLVAHCGDAEEPYARMVLAEIFGVTNHLGTIVWQRSFSPRGGSRNEFTATHDPLLVFARDSLALARVALQRDAQGYSNEDKDPRGEWRAVRQKGSATRRVKTDFAANIPPYRWELAPGSQLPKGLWRISPLTGVIWGKPLEVGKFEFEVLVKDSQEKASKKSISLEVKDTGEAPIPKSVPWLFDADSPPPESEASMQWTGATSSPSPPKILTKALPVAVVGKEYSAVLQASGGSPFAGKKVRPTPPRYYEFTWPRLVEEILKDRVDFGAGGDAVPRLKRFIKEEGDVEYINQQTWWPGSVVKGSDWSTGEDEGVGFTKDATQHLDGLLRRRVIKESVKTSKPELLVAKMLRIFTGQGDLVLEVFGESADMSSVALKLGRHFVYLGGSTDHEVRLLAQCAIPRLKAVVEGKDTPEDAEESTTKRRVSIPFAGGGGFVRLGVGNPIACAQARDENPHLIHEALPADQEVLCRSFAAAEGFVLPSSRGEVTAETLDRRRAAVVLLPRVFLDRSTISRICSDVAPHYDGLTVFFFRSAEDFDPGELTRKVVCKRIPMDLSV